MIRVTRRIRVGDFGGKHLVGTFERFSEQLLKNLERDLCGKIWRKFLNSMLFPNIEYEWLKHFVFVLVGRMSRNVKMREFRFQSFFLYKNSKEFRLAFLVWLCFDSDADVHKVNIVQIIPLSWKLDKMFPLTLNFSKPPATHRLPPVKFKFLNGSA